MERVLDQTATTYPETYVREMTGADLKLILEDVADNLFNPDPYYQQGGDMVRVGGLDYVCDPTQRIGGRISDMTLDDGEKVEAGKSYRVAGWATVNARSPGPPSGRSSRSISATASPPGSTSSTPRSSSTSKATRGWRARPACDEAKSHRIPEYPASRHCAASQSKPCNEGQRLRSAHPFKGLVTEAERRRI